MTNFLSAHLSGKGTVGKKAWEWGKSQGYSDQQLKVAVQQLSNAGVGKNAFFQGASNPMKGVAGMYSSANPLGKYQGTYGNLGLPAYTKAKGEFSASQIQQHLGASGMSFGGAAQKQWGLDIQGERDAALARKQMEDANQAMRDQMDAMQAMYAQKNSTISKSAPYAVGTGGNASLTASAASKGRSRSSSKQTFGRGGAGFKASVNAPAVASASSAASKSLNV